MTGTTDALVLDLVEWVAREPRLYSEVIETWRTSCPRLTIWEDAVNRGYVMRRPTVEGLRVTVTERGAKFLRIPDNYYDDVEAKYGLDAERPAPWTV